MSYLLRVLMVAAVVLPIAHVLTFHMATGHWFPRSEIEVLENPTAVTGWTAKGLELADGRQVPLPGIVAMPVQSIVLEEVIRRGVEVSPGERVWALVKLRRTCGCDPVVTRVMRVDLADMLVFLGEAAPVKPLGETQKKLLAGNTARFTERGWDDSQYSTFVAWRNCALWDE